MQVLSGACHRHVPLLPLGRKDRRKSELVLVEMRRHRLGAGGLRRIEGQLAEKASADRVSPGNLLELVEIAGARADVVVPTLKMRREVGASSRGA